jgi:hypothetical protein
MELNSYSMQNVRIGKVADGKQNAGRFFLVCDLINDDYDTEKKTKQIFWEDVLGMRIDRIRECYPATGKDPEGNEWNGSNSDIVPAEFNQHKAELALRNYEGKDQLLLDNGTYVYGELDGPYCMKYVTNLGEHKEGEWVCDKAGFIRVFTRIKLFVRFKKDGVTPLSGWSVEERLEQRKRNMLPLAAALKEVPNLVDPKYTVGYNVPSVSAEAPVDDEENR